MEGELGKPVRGVGPQFVTSAANIARLIRC